MEKIDNLEEFMKKYDNLDTRKSRTFSSEKSALSSLNIGLKGKLGPGKLEQFGPRSPRCPRRPSFRPGRYSP